MRFTPCSVTVTQFTYRGRETLSCQPKIKHFDTVAVNTDRQDIGHSFVGFRCFGSHISCSYIDVASS